jgi:hypothetical protein
MPEKERKQERELNQKLPILKQSWNLCSSLLELPIRFHAYDFILPSRFWQAFFAPKEHPKIARSFNCGSTPPKNKAPPRLADFYRLKPAVETAGYSHPSPRDRAANPKKDSDAMSRAFCFARASFPM